MKWTPEKIEAVRQRYPHEDNAPLAKELGCSRKALAYRASSMGVKKTEVYNEARYARLGKKTPDALNGCPRRRIETGVLVYKENVLIHYSHAGMNPHADALDDREVVWLPSEASKTDPALVQIGEYGKRVGETHGRAKLSDHEADLVRMLKQDGMPAQEIADKMEISRRYVYKLCNFERRASIVCELRTRGKPGKRQDLTVFDGAFGPRRGRYATPEDNMAAR